MIVRIEQRICPRDIVSMSREALFSRIKSSPRKRGKIAGLALTY